MSRVDKRKRRFLFRTWFYFRQGWSVYFAFVFAAINTLTVTYHLAIEKAPQLQVIFPPFSHYIFVATAMGIPILVLIGYTHYKRTLAFQSEAAVGIESNPFATRNLVNTEIIIKLNLSLIEMLLKLSNEERLSDEERNKISKLNDELKKFITERTLANKDDLKYYKNKIA